MGSIKILARVCQKIKAKKKKYHQMALEYRCCGTGFFSRITVVTFLVLFSGLMSGLTLGLMSMRLVDLEVLAKSGTPNDRKYASNLFLHMTVQ